VNAVEVSPEAVEAVAACGGWGRRVIAIGTTSVRQARRGRSAPWRGC